MVRPVRKRLNKKRASEETTDSVNLNTDVTRKKKKVELIAQHHSNEQEQSSSSDMEDIVDSSAEDAESADEDVESADEGISEDENSNDEDISEEEEECTNTDKINTVKLHIGGLKPATTKEQLEQFLGIDVADFVQKKKVCFAFAVVKAEMVNEIMKKSGEKLNNKKIKISRATAEKRQPWDLGEKSNRLQFGNLPLDTTEQDIRRAFPSAIKIKIDQKPSNKNWKQYAFGVMTFESKDAAEEILSLFQHRKIRGREIRMHFKNRRKNTEGDAPRNKLNVTNIHKDVTLDELNEVFEDAVSACMFIAKGGKKLRALVEFSSTLDATTAMEAFEGHMFNETPIHIKYTSEHKPKKFLARMNRIKAEEKRTIVRQMKNNLNSYKEPEDSGPQNSKDEDNAQTSDSD